MTLNREKLLCISNKGSHIRGTSLTFLKYSTRCNITDESTCPLLWTVSLISKPTLNPVMGGLCWGSRWTGKKRVQLQHDALALISDCFINGQQSVWSKPPQPLSCMSVCSWPLHHSPPDSANLTQGPMHGLSEHSWLRQWLCVCLGLTDMILYVANINIQEIKLLLFDNYYLFAFSASQTLSWIQSCCLFSTF